MEDHVPGLGEAQGGASSGGELQDRQVTSQFLPLRLDTWEALQLSWDRDRGAGRREGVLGSFWNKFYFQQDLIFQQTLLFPQC